MRKLNWHRFYLHHTRRSHPPSITNAPRSHTSKLSEAQKARIAELQSTIFDTLPPHGLARPGSKILRQPLKGPVYTNYYPRTSPPTVTQINALLSRIDPITDQLNRITRVKRSYIRVEGWDAYEEKIEKEKTEDAKKQKKKKK